MSQTFTEEDLEKISEMLHRRILETQHICKMSDQERIWAREGSMYISPEHLPLLGKILKSIDDAATSLGKMVVILCIAGVIWGLSKLGIIDLIK